MPDIFDTLYRIAQDKGKLLFLHDLNPNVTTDTDMSVEMKTFWGTWLLKAVQPMLVHGQFGVKKPLPKNNGKTIEWRYMERLPKALKPLVEGVTPEGLKLVFSNKLFNIQQYGSYVAGTDMLAQTTWDPIIAETNDEVAKQAGLTLDTVIREALNLGLSVQYGPKNKGARYLLTGDDDPSDTTGDYMTSDLVSQMATRLKVNLADRIDGSYVAIIHPYVTRALTRDPEWINVKTYSDPQDIYDNEVGKLWGVRFVESTEAKIFHAEDLSESARELTVNTTGIAAGTAAGATLTIAETLTSDEQDAMEDRKVIINGNLYTIESALSATTLKIKEAIPGNKLTSAAYTLTLSANAAIGATSLSVSGTPAATAIGTQIYTAAGDIYTITGISSSAVTIDHGLVAALASSDVVTSVGIAPGATIYPGEAGADGRDVYSCLFMGKEAYAVTELAGMGLEYIFKPQGAGDDPLNQRWTSGWKSALVAGILREERIIRAEVCVHEHDMV